MGCLLGLMFVHSCGNEAIDIPLLVVCVLTIGIPVTRCFIPFRPIVIGEYRNSVFGMSFDRAWWCVLFRCVRLVSGRIWNVACIHLYITELFYRYTFSVQFAELDATYAINVIYIDIYDKSLPLLDVKRNILVAFFAKVRSSQSHPSNQRQLQNYCSSTLEWSIYLYNCNHKSFAIPYGICVPFSPSWVICTVKGVLGWGSPPI